MSIQPKSSKCPQCGNGVDPSVPYRPFCSQRCKLLDLGAWLDGSHRIPGPELDDESVHDINPDSDPANEDS